MIRATLAAAAAVAAFFALVFILYGGKTTPAAPHTVATFSGSGDQNTTRFTVGGTWKLSYSFDCSPSGGGGNFMVYEDGTGGSAVTVNDIGDGESASTMAYGDAGTHYLEILSECSWTVKVIDES